MNSSSDSTERHHKLGHNLPSNLHEIINGLGNSALKHICHGFGLVLNIRQHDLLPFAARYDVGEVGQKSVEDVAEVCATLRVLDLPASSGFKLCDCATRFARLVIAAIAFCARRASA